MSDETLLDIASSNLEDAILLFEHRKTDDERRLNNVAYYVQQTIELALKHLIELSGYNYPYTHDIRNLYDFIIENDISGLSDELLDLIEMRSDTITSMKTKTRYLKNFRLSITIIEKIISLAKDLIEELNNSKTVEVDNPKFTCMNLDR